MSSQPSATPSAASAPVIGVSARDATSSFGVWNGRNLFVEWSALQLLERLGARPVLVPPGATGAVRRLAGLVLLRRDTPAEAADADRRLGVDAELLRCAVEHGIPLLVLSGPAVGGVEDRALAAALVSEARGG